MSCPNHGEREETLAPCARCGRAFCSDCLVLLLGASYCSECKIDLVRDRLAGIVKGQLDVPSILRRFAGFWLDSLVTAAAVYALMIPLFGLMGVGMARYRSEEPPVAFMILMLLFYPLAFGIPVVYEALLLQHRGQTLGKMALGIRVVRADGGDISRGQAWGRAALRLVFASCFAIDYAPAFFTRERLCLHDLVARTRVVRIST
jgi:uncharacterized RDD family membrane protein YckC